MNKALHILGFIIYNWGVNEEEFHIILDCLDLKAIATEDMVLHFISYSIRRWPAQRWGLKPNVTVSV